MRWTGRGHEAIRATHHKTLELSHDASITERATCVVAVAAVSSPATPLAGPVTITIEADGRSFSFGALANPNWEPTGPAVIRRSSLRLPGTFATHADAAASDLPRELANALTDPETAIDVQVEPIRGRNAVVLFAADPARVDDPRLAAELAVADTVVAEDAVARKLVGGGRVAKLVGVAGRTLVVATADLPGATVPLDVAAPVETVGLSARLAAAAACPSRARLVLVPDDTDRRRAIRAAAATDRLVFRVPVDELDRTLELAQRERGTGVATVAQEYTSPLRAAPGDLPTLARGDYVFCCLHPARAVDALDPAVRAAIAALLTDGVSTRTAARALSELTSMPRRRAYDAVIALARELAQNG